MTIRKRKLLLLDDNFAPGLHEREIRSELLAERGRFVGVAPINSDFAGSTSFSASNYYRSTTNVGPAGSSAMGAAILVRVDAVPSGTQFVFCRGTLGATGGWAFRSSGAAFNFGVVNGAGSAVFSPTYTLTAADVGKVHLFVGTLASTVRLYRNGSEVSSGTAVTGYTAGDATTRTAIGIDGAAANPATNYSIIAGCVANATAPSSVDILGHYYDTRGGRRLRALRGTTHLWDANRGQRDWTDTLAAVVCTKNGAPIDRLEAWSWE